MRRLVFVGGLAALLATGAAVVLVLLRPAPAPSAELHAQLAALDAAIAAGSFSTAREILGTIRSFPGGEKDALSLLKRVFQVGRQTGDHAALADFSARALALNTRSGRLGAVAAYASLRTGRPAEALKILGRSAVAGFGEESLRGEALLRAGAGWTGSDGLTRDLIALEDSQSPAAFAAAAARTGEKRLALDAALLEMRQGSGDAALQIVRSSLDDARFDEPAGLMLYDGGDFGGAAARLERRDRERPWITAIALVLADVFAAAGNTERSERLLLGTLQVAPSVSWTPYADLAFFAALRGDTAGASRRLEDGLAFFPLARELRLMKARVDILAGDQRAAESVLGEVLAARPADSEAALLLLDLQAPTMSPESLRARLWKLFDLVPSDPSVFRALASSLIAAQDWEGVQIAVKQHRASGGQPDAQALIFQGLAAAMRGDDAEAVTAFRRSAVTARDGFARFNSALLLLHGGSVRAALTELDSAAEEVQETAAPGERAKLESRIETLRGEARMLDGDISGAGSALVRARALDPHNLRAGLLLRKLEAGGQ